MLFGLYNRLVDVLVFLAGATLLFILVAVVLDVAARNLGLQPFEWTSTLTEYAMLFVPCLLAPWLVRRGAHIVIDSVTQILPKGARRVAQFAACASCIAICVILGWFCGALTWEYVASGDLDIRSIALPKWILTAVLTLGFALSGIEFAANFQRLIAGKALRHEGTSL